MTQFSLMINSMPRDLAEFGFFLVIGFTAGSMGLIWKSEVSKDQMESNINSLNEIPAY